MNKFLKVAGLVSVVGVTMANASLTVPAIDLTDFEAVAGAVLVAAAAFFGIRKALGLLG